MILPKLFPMSTRLAPSHGALNKLFPTVSHPSTISTLPSCPLSTELFPCYFPRFLVRPRCPSVLLPPNGTLPKLFATVSRPSTMSTLPFHSLRSPKAISHGFLSVHAACSLPPSEALPMSYFPRFPFRP